MGAVAEPQLVVLMDYYPLGTMFYWGSKWDLQSKYLNPYTISLTLTKTFNDIVLSRKYERESTPKLALKSSATIHFLETRLCMKYLTALSHLVL